MYEDIKFFYLLEIRQNRIDVLCENFLIVVNVYRMADADNRVILNVGGIRHETCTLIMIFFVLL